MVLLLPIFFYFENLNLLGDVSKTCNMTVPSDAN